MPSYSNLDDRRGSQSLTVRSIQPTHRVRPWNAVSLFSVVCRLLALLLALAVAPTVTFAGEAAHDQGHVNDPTGRFVVHTWGHLSKRNLFMDRSHFSELHHLIGNFEIGREEACFLCFKPQAWSNRSRSPMGNRRRPRRPNERQEEGRQPKAPTSAGISPGVLSPSESVFPLVAFGFF